MNLDNPAQTLAETGGAPLLAHVAMGANPKDVLAGYFGASDYGEWLKTLPGDQSSLVEGVRKQLEDIQGNTDLRNQAVSQIVSDFPNIAAQAAQIRKASGEEFDAVTKGYLDQALNGTAAKFAAGGNLSSGASAAAMAKVGADFGQDKLNYMDSREQTAYGQGVQSWQVKYNDALKQQKQQQDMLGMVTKQGFNAQQNALDRTTYSNIKMAGFANDENMFKQESDNAMLGMIGQLGSSAIYYGARNSGKSSTGKNLFGATSGPSNTFETDSFNSNLA